MVLLAFSLLLTMAACGEPEQEELQGIPGITVPDVDNEAVPTSDGETESTEKEGLRTEPFVIPDTDEEQEGSIDPTSRNYIQVAMNFVAAIAQNYYTSALTGFDAEESPYITAEDIAYAVPRSTYKGIANWAGKEVYLSVDEEECTGNDETAYVVVELRTTDDEILNSYTLGLRLNKDNKWNIVDSDFYETDYYITVPGNVTLYINDTEVSKDLIDHKAGYNEYMDCYKIPLIGKSVKTLKITCDAYEDQAEAVPATNNSEEPFRLDHDLVDTELNDALNAIKTLWESLYQDYVNGVPETEWLKYFSTNAPATYVNEIKSSFDDLTEENSEHRITLMQKRSDAECYYLTDEVFAVNVQYQMDYVWDTANWGQQGKRYSHILLTIEDGQYKIFEVSDMKLFREAGGSDW